MSDGQFGYDPDDPADLWENITPVTPEEFMNSPVKIEVPGRFLNLLPRSTGPWTCSLHAVRLAAGENCQACWDEHEARR